MAMAYALVNEFFCYVVWCPTHERIALSGTSNWRQCSEEESWHFHYARWSRWPLRIVYGRCDLCAPESFGCGFYLPLAQTG